MRLAGGWQIHHLSDRVVELRKDSYEYRRLTGRDGFVRARCEPGMDRSTLIDRALQQAVKSDEALALRVAKEMMPKADALAKYKRQISGMAGAFGTPEEPELIGVKRA